MIKFILMTISAVGLFLTIIPAIMVYWGSSTLAENRNFMTIGTFLWFLSAPFWMNKKSEKTAAP